MLELLNLPDIVLEKILSYLSYDDVSKYRISFLANTYLKLFSSLQPRRDGCKFRFQHFMPFVFSTRLEAREQFQVCRQFDTLCKQLLNKGFILAEKQHAQCLRAVKSQLPRRESERRSHPLARHCDILTAVETRLSMLAMTFTKYIDAGLCCFIPGKVIDEIFNVLGCLRNSKTPPRAHEVLQELRDISSMAMEHFDEKIVPVLKNNLNASCIHSAYSLSGSGLMRSATTTRILGQEKLRLEFNKIHSRAKQNRESVSNLKKVIDTLTLKVKRYGIVISYQKSRIGAQDSKIADLSAKVKEQEAQITEMKRHLEEWDHKFGDLVAELSRAREESNPIAELSCSQEDNSNRVREEGAPIPAESECSEATSRSSPDLDTRENQAIKRCALVHAPTKAKRRCP